jgi:hypothetical protein
LEFRHFGSRQFNHVELDLCVKAAVNVPFRHFVFGMERIRRSRGG